MRGALCMCWRRLRWSMSAAGCFRDSSMWGLCSMLTLLRWLYHCISDDQVPLLPTLLTLAFIPVPCVVCLGAYPLSWYGNINGERNQKLA